MIKFKLNIVLNGLKTILLYKKFTLCINTLYVVFNILFVFIIVRHKRKLFCCTACVLFFYILGKRLNFMAFPMKIFVWVHLYYPLK